MAQTAKVRVGIEIALPVCARPRSHPDGRLGVTQTVETVSASETADKLDALIASLKEGVGGFDRIGIAVPGLVDRATGKVAFSTHMPEHTTLDLVTYLREATGVTAVVENDANAAAWGEYRLGAGRGSDNLFYATLGDGVGGAFILNGELWHGASGFAGEFGYVPINSEGMRLEEVASAENIIRRTRARFHTDSTSSLNKLSEESITLSDIIGAAAADDDFAQMMLQRTGVYVGTAIASVINLLNIERCVVGGDIMEAKHIVLDSIKSRARELAFEPSFNSTKIVEGELGAYAAAAGAALLAHDKNNSEN